MDPQRELLSVLGRAIELVGLIEPAAPQKSISDDKPSAERPLKRAEPGKPLPPDEPVIVRPLKRAFAMVGVGNTRGHELINEGVFEVVSLGKRAKGITMRSIRRLQASTE